MSLVVTPCSFRKAPSAVSLFQASFSERPFPWCTNFSFCWNFYRWLWACWSVSSKGKSTENSAHGEGNKKSDNQIFFHVYYRYSLLINWSNAIYFQLTNTSIIRNSFKINHLTRKRRPRNMPWSPFLSGWRDSNPRPLRPERSTLPTEPHPELSFFLCPWADLNCRPLVSETTALSTELQGLAVPKIIISGSFLNYFWLRSQARRRQDLHSWPLRPWNHSTTVAKNRPQEKGFEQESSVSVGTAPCKAAEHRRSEEFSPALISESVRPWTFRDSSFARSCQPGW